MEQIINNAKYLLASFRKTFVTYRDLYKNRLMNLKRLQTV